MYKPRTHHSNWGVCVVFCCLMAAEMVLSSVSRSVFSCIVVCFL